MADSSLQARGNAVYQYTGLDLSTSRGLLLSASAGTLAVNTSASVPATCVCLDGAAAAKVSTVAVLGQVPGPVFVKLSGTVAAYQRIAQHTDGGVIADAGTGARVVVGCLGEVGGVSGDIVPACLGLPQLYTS